VDVDVDVETGVRTRPRSTVQQMSQCRCVHYDWVCVIYLYVMSVLETGTIHSVVFSATGTR
jgi:hypothetical protein